MPVWQRAFTAYGRTPRPCPASRVETGGKNSIVFNQRTRNAVVPQSIQAYRFETARREGQVADARKVHAAGGKSGRYPRMPDVDRAGGNVTGPLHAGIDGEALHCRFALRPRDGRLVLAGARRARALVAEFLATAVGGRPRSGVVYPHHLNVKQMLRLFDGVAGQDGRSIINRLAPHSEPKLGRRYAQETYALIAYSFAESRCASRHRDFKSLCRDAKETEMRFLISGCAGVATDRGGLGLHAMVARPDRSFMMYRDVSPDSWPAFCDALLGFLSEVDG